MRLVERLACEYGVPERIDAFMLALSAKVFWVGETAVRVAVTDVFPLFAFLLATFTLDDEPVLVDPRVSPPCIAWKRVTVVFKLPSFISTDVFTSVLIFDFPSDPPLAPGSGDAAPFPLEDLGSLSTRCNGAGVGGGEINATFFAAALSAVELVVCPVVLESVVFRALRTTV